MTSLRFAVPGGFVGRLLFVPGQLSRDIGSESWR